jgi:hypothetical protein
MRVFVASLVLGIMLVSVASAELLSTALPLGQGKWAVEGAGLLDSNVNNNMTPIGAATLTMNTIGGYVGYGITDKLDAYLQYGSSSVAGGPTINGTVVAAIAHIPALAALPGSVASGQTMSTIGLTAKYTFIQEGKGLPVTVAGGLGYRTINFTQISGWVDSMTAPTKVVEVDTTSTGSQIMAGVGVSKMMIPFVPYAGLAYRSLTQSGNAVSTQLDLTVGTLFAFSTKAFVFIEDTMQSITPNGGTAYSSNQIAAAVAYAIN